MEVYRSDEEQLEAVKKWWKENGRSVIYGIVIGLSLVVGWGAWQNNRQKTAEQASDLYQELLQAIEEKQTDSALKLSERIADNFAGSTYAVFGNLLLAKLQLERGDAESAKKALNAVLSSDTDDDYKHVARLRLIRILGSNGEAEAGLKMIAETNLAKAGEYEGGYEELRGDLYVTLNKQAEARASFQRAQQLGTSSPYIQLKLDDLAAPSIPELSD